MNDEFLNVDFLTPVPDSLLPTPYFSSSTQLSISFLEYFEHFIVEKHEVNFLQAGAHFNMFEHRSDHHHGALLDRESARTCAQRRKRQALDGLFLGAHKSLARSKTNGFRSRLLTRSQAV